MPPEAVADTTIQTDQPAETTPDVTQEFTVADHAKQFGPEGTREPVVDDAPAEDAAPSQPHPSTQQRRDRDGTFKPGKVRHRAASQQAAPEDAPRIQALTGRAKAAEEKAAALEKQLAALRQPAPAPVATGDDPEPSSTDQKYQDKPADYWRDLAKWSARQEVKSARQAEVEAKTKAEKEQAQHALMTGWSSRIDEARKKYPDYDAVAMQFAPWLDRQGRPVSVQGAAIDAFVMEDDAGADVLYYLQSHPEERDSLLEMTSQTKVLRELALLSQRLLSPSSAQAGTTGSAARQSHIVLPPKPPNPVRTEAQRASDPPPPTDGSLSIAEHARAFGPKR